MDLEKVSNNLQEFYNTWKMVVWAIKILYTENGVNYKSSGTAFSVSSDGLILTSSHSFPRRSSYEVYVRRLDETNFQYAKVVFEEPKWDVALLHVRDVNDCQYAILSNDNSLSVGQTLLHIGNPHNLVGSFLMGKVAFGCTDHVELPSTNVTCRTYKPTALTNTPRYRIMGDIRNLHTLDPSSGSSFEKNLHPLVPVIQMYGLLIGEGSSGGPVFNVKGEVVGMVALVTQGYEIAIHVAILREVLRLFKEQHVGDEDGKRKDIPDPKVQAGDIKKFKTLQADQKGKVLEGLRSEITSNA